MITEDYVSFEVARLLKEKGFHEKVNHVYHYYNTAPFYHRHLRDFNGEDYKNFRHEHYSAPTLQMAMKWLREVHKLSVRPRYDEVEDEKERVFYVWFFDILYMKPYKMLVEPEQGYSTYEEACEAAIKYCLENLI